MRAALNFPGVVRAVSSKLGELEVELQRSQRSVEIPQIRLEIMRKIADVCKQVIMCHCRPDTREDKRLLFDL